MKLIEFNTGTVSIVIYEDNIIMLEQGDGEAMQVGIAELDEILQQYYQENF